MTSTTPGPSTCDTAGVAVGPSTCRTCQYFFTDREDQVLHYKLDWHAYNVKQLLRHTDPLPEHEFNARCDDDLSSLSGDESDPEDEAIVTSHFLDETPELADAVVSRPHIVFKFNGEFYKSLYSLFFCSGTVLTDGILSECITQHTNTASGVLQYRGRVAVFLYSAQHFAGAVYENDALILHKTYHRYTVRAKQGTVQGIRDGKGNAPKSYGASLRRYNQIALFNEVEAIISLWSDTLVGCNVIFHRTAVHNKHVFDKIKDQLHVKPGPSKIRTIPFTTYRPTLKETKRVYGVLTRITPSSAEEFSQIKSGKEPEHDHELTTPGPKTPQPPNPKSIPNSHLKQRPEKARSPVPELEPETKPWYEEENCIFYKILESASSNNYQLFTALLCGVDLAQAGNVEIETDREFILTVDVNVRLDSDNTLLHHCALATNHRCTSFLLHHHANPELKNVHNKVPYELARNKEVRDEFRRFMGRYPEMWDYKAAKIPSPLTPAMEEEQAEKRKERRKAQRAAKSVRDKERKEAAKETAKKEEDKLIGEAQALRMRGLDARERCLLAAEARIAAEAGTRGSVSGKCENCETGLDGLVPFERLQYKYCSVTCVREHKDKIS